MNKNILGVSFEEASLEDIQRKITESLETKKSLRIATVNPEFLVAVQKDTRLKENLLNADLRVVDGFGLYKIARFFGWRGTRITGVELTEWLLQTAEQGQYSVRIVLNKIGLSSWDKVQAVVQKNYPKLHFDLAYQGDTFPRSDITLVALGIPAQEYLAASIPQGVVLGVGGAIDFLTGTQKRAPKILQKIGLEWLWRLFWQPKRLKRIWKAVVVFPFLVLFESARK